MMAKCGKSERLLITPQPNLQIQILHFDSCFPKMEFTDSVPKLAKKAPYSITPTPLRLKNRFLRALRFRLSLVETLLCWSINRMFTSFMFSIVFNCDHTVAKEAFTFICPSTYLHTILTAQVRTVSQFQNSAFNIHPPSSSHPFTASPIISPAEALELESCWRRNFFVKHILCIMLQKLFRWNIVYQRFLPFSRHPWTKPKERCSFVPHCILACIAFVEPTWRKVSLNPAMAIRSESVRSQPKLAMQEIQNTMVPKAIRAIINPRRQKLLISC